MAFSLVIKHSKIYLQYNPETVNNKILITISGVVVQMKHPLMMLQLMVLVTAGYSDTFLSFTTLLPGCTFKFLLC